jgi:hypothetical protein
VQGICFIILGWSWSLSSIGQLGPPIPTAPSPTTTTSSISNNLKGKLSLERESAISLSSSAQYLPILQLEVSIFLLLSSMSVYYSMMILDKLQSRYPGLLHLTPTGSRRVRWVQVCFCLYNNNNERRDLRCICDSDSRYVFFLSFFFPLY